MANIKVGIFGAGRGMNLAKDILLNGCDVVAVCDFNEVRLKNAVKAYGGEIATYDSFDKFIEHDMDAVVLANYFHEHTPYAIECFRRGIHVFCECISNGTMAEGVELIREFEKSKSIFMLAENYPAMSFNREMKRVCEGGTLGKILYAEGEYNHPISAKDAGFSKGYVYFDKHWRRFNPRCYYITHSLGPIMNATGATPKRVTAFAAFAPVEETEPCVRYVGDRAAVITTQNDDGSIFRVSACSAFGAHHNSYRICGTKGQIENLRGMGEKIMLRYNAWEKPEGMEEINCYDPVIEDKDDEIIKNSGHGGGDYITFRNFVDCIKAGKQPDHPFDIYSAVTMSSVAILGHRSVLNGGMPYDIPDFRKEEDRKLFENDRLSPFYGTDGREPSIPCCSHPDYKPTDEQIKMYLKQLE
ncbi:MAG: Gfo/Idh/MocA family oxidoreductase [Ruminococcaceae bacterium]|nr:Gfo/Idh/MocA family oxidoreductase [Oscillospiraceae bacterium]